MTTNLYLVTCGGKIKYIKKDKLKKIPLLWSLLPLMMLLNEIGAEGFVILIVAGVFETTTPTRPVGQVWSNAIL